MLTRRSLCLRGSAGKRFSHSVTLTFDPMTMKTFCCATSQTVYSRQSSLPGRRCPTLEQLAWRHRSGWFAVDVPAPTETSSVPAVLPRCCTVTVAQLCYCDTLSGPSGGSSYLGHYKNWLMDWLIDWHSIADHWQMTNCSTVGQRHQCVNNMPTVITWQVFHLFVSLSLQPIHHQATQ